MSNANTPSAIWIGHRYLDLLKPRFFEDELDGLIWPTLARLPRYNVIGTRRVWTVGQHLLLGFELAGLPSSDGKHQPSNDSSGTAVTIEWGWLVHDAAEAFIGDKTSPLKCAERALLAPSKRGRRQDKLPFDEIEYRLYRAMSSHWEFPHLGQSGAEIADRIHYLDAVTAQVEKYYLVSSTAGPWGNLPEVPWGAENPSPVEIDSAFDRIANLSAEDVTSVLFRRAIQTRIMSVSSRNL